MGPGVTSKMSIVRLPTVEDQEGTRDRAIRLFRFLRAVTELRSQPIRTLERYPEVLWLSQVPEERECSVIWRSSSSADTDSWLRVRKPSLPVRPDPPRVLDDWLIPEELDDSSLDFPPLHYPRIEVPTGSASMEPDPDPPAAVRDAHARYVEHDWWPWALKDRRVQPILKVYKQLFTIYQRQRQLGEQYEVVLGVGLLTWTPETGSTQPIRRHLLVANCSLEFDPDRAVISLGPGGDRTQLALEQEMLDAEVRVSGAPLTQIAQLLEAEDALTNQDTLTRALRTWVNAASPSGRCSEGLVPPSESGVDPVVTLAPALILRPRGERSLLEMFDGIIENLMGGGALPAGVRGLVEVEDDEVPEEERSSLLPDGTIYFPLDANREQLDIVRKLSAHHGVLVQGPPGTGKSHTIANLVAHLLACGQRVLVTSQAPRALEVLRELLPEEIAALAVLLLGSDAKSIQSMEDSVQGISARFQSWDQGRAGDEIVRLEKERDQVLRREAEVRAELRKLRRRDSDEVDPLPGGYRGTRQRVAERLSTEREELGWLSGSTASGPPPLSNHEALQLLDALRQFPDIRRQADSQRLIDLRHLPSPDLFGQRVEVERKAADLARRQAAAVGVRLPPGMEKVDSASLQAAGAAVKKLLQGLELLQPRQGDWARRPWDDLVRGSDTHWVSLRGDTATALTALEGAQDVLTQRRVSGIEASQRDSVRGPARTVSERLKQGRGLGFRLLQPRPLRDALEALDRIRVDGLPVDRAEAAEALIRWINAWDRMDDLEGLWQKVNPAPAGGIGSRLAHYRDSLQRLDQLLELQPARKRAAELVAAANLPISGAARWEDLSGIRYCFALLAAEASRRGAASAAAPIQETLSQLRNVAARVDSHPCVGTLWRAVQARDAEAYSRAYRELELADAGQRRAEAAVHLLDRLGNALPQVAGELVATAQLPHWDGRLAQIESAWNWLLADSWLRQRSASEEPQKLLGELEALHRKSLSIARDLAAAGAWQYCLRRLTPGHRQHLQAWSQAMRRVGRGTGKYAASHRKNARDHLEACRDAIPAWIMPIYRVAETLRAGVDAFDVVIVDEASQSGPDALFLNYLARKMVVVGDDMQISPSQVGLNLAEVDTLARELLEDVPHRDALTFRDSLFDQAKIRFSARVGLREHFRCMPEIIQFSNDLCYRSEPLIAVRQFGAGRLSPVVITRHVRDGYLKEGRGDQNPAEAHAIVDTIVQCCANPAYDGKTMGVISLVGDTQAKLIETMLVKQLGPEEMERRQLTCGNSYAFQGAERHVMFLSMVSAVSETHRMTSLTGEHDRQRFNVAASRAQDQMWLFHSLTLDDFHTSDDLRYRLLAYCQNPHLEPTASIGRERLDEMERRARIRAAGESPPEPFESWFELDVFLGLVRRGFHVTPQYPLAGYWVDLMVQGLHGRVAVECDGDYWHGPERHDADMARQQELERCGLRFIRIAGSQYYLDREGSLNEVVEELQRQHVSPIGRPESPQRSQRVASPFAGTSESGVPVGDEPASSGPIANPNVASDAAPGSEEAGAAPTMESRDPRPAEGYGSLSGPARTETDSAFPRTRSTSSAPDGGATPAAFNGPLDRTGSASSQTEDSAGIAPARRLALEREGAVTPSPARRPAPPTSAAPRRVAEALVEMIGAEGPVIVEVLFRHYVRASGGRKVGTQIREDLLRALHIAVSSGQVLLRKELGTTDQLRAVVRLPSTPEVLVRDRKPEHSIREIPPSEVASVMRSLAHDYQGHARGEALYSRVLKRYHMVRLTNDAHRYLDEIANFYLK